MRSATLNGIAAAILVLIGIMASPARAQQDSATAEAAFCAFTGLDLLAALDGSWTIKQGPGTAYAGAMAIPLPPPPATPVSFKFDSSRHVIDVRGASFEEEMTMFPSAAPQQDAAGLLVGPPPSQPIMAPVCSWLEAPTVVATNFYFFLGDQPMTLMKAKLFDDDCDLVENSLKLSDKEIKSLDPLNPVKNPKKFKTSMQKFWDINCKKPPADFEHLDMEMTLVLRFTSKNSGSGMVYFAGQTDRSKFAASAPVTISR